MIKIYIICFIFFLIIGELIHNYIKSINNSLPNNNVKTNKKEAFKNYNELPHLTDLSKSNFRYIDNDNYEPNINLQPIVVKTKIPVLLNGDLPTLGYYIDNNYGNTIIVKMLKKYVIPINTNSYNTSLNILNDLVNYKINLGIIRDYEVINYIKNHNNIKNTYNKKIYNKKKYNKSNNKNNSKEINDDIINVVCPLLYETIYILKKEDLNLEHLQYINIQDNIIRIFTILNDKPILDTLILYLNIDTRKIEINVLSTPEKCISNFILEEKSILFICCHFKNGYLQSLLENNKCYVLDFIPTINSLMAIGNYSKNNPINDDALEKIRVNILKLLCEELHVKIYNHNLSKNNVLSLNSASIYETFNIRNSLYIYNKFFTDYQQELLSKNIIKYYQTFLAEINKWNNIPELNNIDNTSLDFLHLSNVNKSINFNEYIKNELINMNLIKIKYVN